jgi:hypothetical protein
MPEFPASLPTRQLVLDLFPDRPKPPLFFYDQGLRCTFAYQNKKAPLVFLIGGAGASDRTAKLLTMMKALHQAGFHVITLPSPTSSNFVISASRSRYKVIFRFLPFTCAATVWGAVKPPLWPNWMSSVGCLTSTRC